MHDTIGLRPRAAQAVDNTDWLKAAAIMLVAVDATVLATLGREQAADAWAERA
ncbi:MAG: hypothetical protein WAN86_27295 [Hyphomicrobiaceae bacterium]